MSAQFSGRINGLQLVIAGASRTSRDISWNRDHQTANMKDAMLIEQVQSYQEAEYQNL